MYRTGITLNSVVCLFSCYSSTCVFFLGLFLKIEGFNVAFSLQAHLKLEFLHLSGCPDRERWRRLQLCFLHGNFGGGESLLVGQV
jgi:hypothetical protein